MTDLGNKYRTDKGTVTGNRHAYTCLYDLLFAGFRNQPLSLMEIGLNIGGPELDASPDRKVNDIPSVRMWREYFPEAHVHGVDISDFSAFQTPNFTFYQADCGDVEALQRVAAVAPPCDIIIDDGSHASYHQQLTLLKLFPILKPGGLFIIEDLDWQPARYERELPRVPKTRDLLADILRDGAAEGTGAIDRWEWVSLLSEVENIMLIDTGKLNEMGSFFNRNRLRTDRHYAQPRWLSKDSLRLMAKRGLELAQFAVGSRRYARNRTKLAIIQKRHDPARAAAVDAAA